MIVTPGQWGQQTQMSSIAAQLNRYNPNRDRYRDSIQPSIRSYQSQVNSQFGDSRIQSPKSKMALLNQKLIAETDQFNRRRSGSFRSGSRSRMQKSWENKQRDFDPRIKEYLAMEEKCRKRNVIAKYRVISGEVLDPQDRPRKYLPPKSPLVVSQKLKVSKRQIQSAQQGRSNAYVQAKKAMNQLVFVTDQSSLQSDSSAQYRSVRDKQDTESRPKSSRVFEKPFQRSFGQPSSFSNVRYITIDHSRNQTPKFSEIPILSPLQLQDQEYHRDPQLSRHTSHILPLGPVSHAKRWDKRAMYSSVVVTTLIVVLMLYQIIK